MAKGAYIGISTQVPVYEEHEQEVYLFTEDELLEYFDIIDYPYDEDYPMDKGQKYFDNQYMISLSNNNYADEDNPDYDSDTTSGTLLRAKKTVPTFSFYWYVSSEANYDKLIITQNNINIVEASGEQEGTWTGSLTIDDKIYISYVKDSSSYGGSDEAYVTNFQGSIITQVQIDTITKPLARNISNVYLGINNISRQIVAAYVGVGGIARPFWGFEDLVHYGKFDISNFGQAVTAASLKNKAFFGRGSNIMTYDIALTQTVHENILASSLHTGEFSHWPASGSANTTTTSELVFNNDLIAFADSVAMTTINKDLTSVAWPWHGPYLTSTSNTYASLGGGATASSTNYAFVGGGVTGVISTGQSPTHKITPYSTSGTKQSTLYTAALGWPGTISNFNGYAIFSSGVYSQGSDYYGKTVTTDVFNDNLTRSTFTSLSSYRSKPLCENLNNTYAVITGGGTTYDGNGVQQSDAEVYNIYGTKQILALGVHPDVVCKTPLIRDNSKLLLREADVFNYDTRIYTLDMNLTLELVQQNLTSPKGNAIEDGVGSYVGRYAIIVGGSYYNSANDGDGYYKNSYPYMHAYKAI